MRVNLVLLIVLVVRRLGWPGGGLDLQVLVAERAVLGRLGVAPLGAARGSAAAGRRNIERLMEDLLTTR